MATTQTNPAETKLFSAGELLYFQALRRCEWRGFTIDGGGLVGLRLSRDWSPEEGANQGGPYAISNTYHGYTVEFLAALEDGKVGEAVRAALPLLMDDLASTLECHCIVKNDIPDEDTLEPSAVEHVTKLRHAIALLNALLPTTEASTNG